MYQSTVPSVSHGRCDAEPNVSPLARAGAYFPGDRRIDNVRLTRALAASAVGRGAALLTGRPVRHTVGMTGEVTLQGRVLPIGGLKQKVLAAHAAGLTEVIVPERNQHDLDDVPSDVRDRMQFHIVSSVDQVLAVALAPSELAMAA